MIDPPLTEEYMTRLWEMGYYLSMDANRSKLLVVSLRASRELNEHELLDVAKRAFDDGNHDLLRLLRRLAQHAPEYYANIMRIYYNERYKNLSWTDQ